MKGPLPDKFPELPYMQILFSFDGNKLPKPLRSPGKQEYCSIVVFCEIAKVLHTSATEGKNMLYNKLCLTGPHRPGMFTTSLTQTQTAQEHYQLEMKQTEQWLSNVTPWNYRSLHLPICQNAATAKSLPTFKYAKCENLSSRFWWF